MNIKRLREKNHVPPPPKKKKKTCTDIIGCIVFNAVLNRFQLFPGGQCTYPCLSGVLLISTQHNILSKTLAAFPHNHCRTKGQLLEMNKSCHNDYHQFSERILAKPGIEPGTSCSQVRNATDSAMVLGCTDMTAKEKPKMYTKKRIAHQIKYVRKSRQEAVLM